ncbi:LamG domain-containing protein [Candidatus Poribacteria bacterium]
MKRSLFSTTILFGVIAATTFAFVGLSLAYELIAAWPMDEGSGDEMSDLSGNGHDGEFFGNPEWANGKFGKGIQFHGAPDHIEVPDPDHELTPEHITLVCWVNLDDDVDTHAIMEQYDWAAGKGAYCLRTGGKQLAFYTQNGASDAGASVGGAVKAGEWFHAAATFDGDVMRTYVNGELVASFDVTVFTALLPSDKSLSFGVRGDSKDTHWMMGTLDEAAIFNEALSEEEIKNIMDNGLQATVLAVSTSGKLATTWGRMKNDK